jgi:hypothetical protein
MTKNMLYIMFASMISEVFVTYAIPNYNLLIIHYIFMIENKITCLHICFSSSVHALENNKKRSIHVRQKRNRMHE